MGWEAEGGLYHTLKQKSSHCVLTEIQKGAQCTCQAETVVDSSLIASIALSVHPVAPYTHIALSKIDKVTKMMQVNVDLAMNSCFISVSGWCWSVAFMQI